jgi:polyhydroxybutyrate depolymerase
MMKTLIKVLTLAAVLSAYVHAFGAPTTMTWTVGPDQREALVFAPPPNIQGGAHPLVFFFHGHGGTMQGAAQLAHIQTLWPDAIVVYPQGLPTPVLSTNAPPPLHSGWQVEANQPAPVGNRDLKFFDAMVATLRQTYPVDEKRIYSAGFSNGAIFTYLLWAERGNVLAAVGICAGRLWPTEQLTQPRAAFIIGGQNDQTVPFVLQQQSIQAVRQVDSATGPGQPCGSSCTFYPSVTQTPVVTHIHAGGHIYPVWASSEFVQFFKNHQHP